MLEMKEMKNLGNETRDLGEVSGEMSGGGRSREGTGTHICIQEEAEGITGKEEVGVDRAEGDGVC